MGREHKEIQAGLEAEEEEGEEGEMMHVWDQG